MRLHEVFCSSIRAHAVREHAGEQLSACSPTPDVAFSKRWIERMGRIRPFVVEVVGSDAPEIAAYVEEEERDLLKKVARYFAREPE